jgi:HPr kinase/phosphorylase
MNAGQGVTVGKLLESRPETLGLDLEILAGSGGLGRRILSPYVQKTGLALAGFHEYLREGRVLVFGNSEIRYLESLKPDDRTDTMRKVCEHDEVPCILVTGGLRAFGEMIFEAERSHLPVLRTLVPTPVAMAKVTAILEDSFVARELLHGVLLDILGLGVLIVGESGIGKSECALDLIVRGHRLVADDTVEVRRRAETILIGTCPELTRHHMEIRGLGVINIQDLFGIAATRTSKRIELVVQLERWESRRDYPASRDPVWRGSADAWAAADDRLGLGDERYLILNLPLPLIRMPVAPGRNLAILVEIAARNQLLRARGHHAARKLADRLERQLQLAGVDELDESEIEDLPDAGEEP